jgi:hypothetical protein
MQETERNLLPDGFLSLEGGMNAGIAPTLVPKNQVAMSVNTTFRGGFASCRPAWVKKALTLTEAHPLLTTVTDAFNGGTEWFQGAAAFDSPYDNSSLVASIGGHIFRIRLLDFNVTDITPSVPDPDPAIAPTLYPNNPNLRKAWFQQAENWMVIQDDQSSAIIFDGASTRRSNYAEMEVPTGSCMAYGNGRLWVAHRRYFVGGDIVGGPSGTLDNDYKDSVLKFTENSYIASGGSFTVPIQSGDITTLQFVAQLDTALGQGELVIGTANSVFTMNVPWSRDEWKTTAEPLIRTAQIGFGPTSDDGATLVNGDLFYRGKDRSIRSLIMATRDFSQWGNTPISNELQPILSDDSRHLLQYCSAVTFDNRAMVTVSPKLTPIGVAHRGIAAINFDLISSLGNRVSPCWEGIWTGLNILKLVVAEFKGEDRLFAFVENDGVIELWEMDLSAVDDNNEKQIEWYFDSRAIQWERPFALKRLEGGDMFVDQMDGDIDFSVSWRPGQISSWVNWHTWSECATTSTCDKERCTVPSTLAKQARVHMPIPEPPDGCDVNNTMPNREFYDAQFRVSVTGRCRVKQMRLWSRSVEAPTKTPCPEGTCASEEACNEQIYGYTSHET